MEFAVELTLWNSQYGTRTLHGVRHPVQVRSVSPSNWLRIAFIKACNLLLATLTSCKHPADKLITDRLSRRLVCCGSKNSENSENSFGRIHFSRKDDNLTLLSGITGQSCIIHNLDKILTRSTGKFPVCFKRRQDVEAYASTRCLLGISLESVCLTKKFRESPAV